MSLADRARLPVEATPGADKGSLGRLPIDYASRCDSNL